MGPIEQQNPHGDPNPPQTLQRNQTQKFNGQRLKIRVSFNNSHLHSISQYYRRAQSHLSPLKIDVTLELTQRYTLPFFLNLFLLSTLKQISTPIYHITVQQFFQSSIQLAVNACYTDWELPLHLHGWKVDYFILLSNPSAEYKL